MMEKINRKIRLILALGFALGCNNAPPPFDLAAADRAIEKAEHFLKNKNTLKPDELAILSYLDRKFKLPWVAKRLDRGTMTEISSGTWASFLRLLQPGYKISQEAIQARTSTIDRMTLAALYCDAHGFPEHFQEKLQIAFKAHTYWPTHAVVAAMWANENGCFTQSEWNALRPSMLDALLRTIALHPDVDDFYAEALALMYYAGFRDHVNPAWLAKLIAAQNYFGGWGASRWDLPNNAHTTSLALWALLEARRAGAPSIHWVR